MFGLNAPHKRGAETDTSRPGNEEDEFVPDSAANREREAVLQMVKAGKKLEKSLLGNRQAVAEAIIAQGGKMSLDVAGLAVMSGARPGQPPVQSGAECSATPNIPGFDIAGPAMPTDKDKKKAAKRRKKDKKKKKKKETKKKG